MHIMDEFKLYRWASLLLTMGPAYYWWGYPAPIFVAGIMLFLYSQITVFTKLFATSVIVLNDSILNIKEEKDEDKTQSLHG